MMAQSTNAKPSCRILRSVRHHEADDVAFAYAVAHRPAGIAVSSGIELPIGECLVLRDECRSIAKFRGKVVEGITKGTRLIASHRRNQPQGPQYPSTKFIVTFEIIDEAHMVP